MLTIQTLAAYFTAKLNIKSERGATAVEYGIMVALIAVAIVGTVLTLGTKLDGVFQTVVGKLP